MSATAQEPKEQDWLVLIDRYSDGPLGPASHPSNEGEMEWKIVPAVDERSAIEAATKDERATLSSPRAGGGKLGTPTHRATAMPLVGMKIFPFRVKKQTVYSFEWAE